jgi:hypothetical protein
MMNIRPKAALRHLSHEDEISLTEGWYIFGCRGPA